MASEVNVGDRVRLSFAGKNLDGTVYELLENGKRVRVRWDRETDETHSVWHNIKPLELLPKPKVHTFCGYCLMNFASAGPGESQQLTVQNSRNGVAFHLECARVIAETVKLFDERKP